VHNPAMPRNREQDSPTSQGVVLCSQSRWRSHPDRQGGPGGRRRDLAERWEHRRPKRHGLEGGSLDRSAHRPQACPLTRQLGATEGPGLCARGLVRCGGTIRPSTLSSKSRRARGRAAAQDTRKDTPSGCPRTIRSREWSGRREMTVRTWCLPISWLLDAGLRRVRVGCGVNRQLRDPGW
jgi:hypothetical protein